MRKKRGQKCRLWYRHRDIFGEKYGIKRTDGRLGLLILIPCMGYIVFARSVLSTRLLVCKGFSTHLTQPSFTSVVHCRGSFATMPPLPRVRLDAGGSMLPRLDKEDTGGEDAFFITDHVCGVFDGVGGWADSGVDSGLFSRALASGCATWIENQNRLEKKHSSNLVEALAAGLASDEHIGTSTACLACISPEGELTALNLGARRPFQILENDTPQVMTTSMLLSSHRTPC